MRKRSHRRTKAATQDILAEAAPRTRVPRRWEKYARILIRLREQLRRQEGDLKRDALEEYTGPRRVPADVATNTYDRDWALGMVSSEQEALYEIEGALDRIRTGAYGVCQLTGKRIPKARLDAVPWTRFTAEAERELEKTGELRGARLGELGRVPKENPPESYGIEPEP
jgi:RNA polymerase-binding transcription factor DksA